MHLKDNFTRELEENVSLILAVGIDSYLQFSKQAMLFHASLSLSLSISVPFAGNTCSTLLCLSNSSSSKTQLRCHLLSEAFLDWPFNRDPMPFYCAFTTP